MRLHRFIGEFDLSEERLKVRDVALANQVMNVLRMGEGDSLVLCDGQGTDALASIVSGGKSELELVIQERHASVPEPARHITLYAALIRRENFELIVQKAVESGASEIVPVLTARTVRQGFRMDRFMKIAREAAEQSGRGRVPGISEPLPFAKAVAVAAKDGALSFLDLGGAPAAKALSIVGAARISLFVGPEGGWEAEERELAEKHGALILGLGARTLRAETAAIVATYLAANP